MFKQLVTLSTEAHRSLRFQPNQPYHFAADQGLIPLAAGEITRVAREMVVLFPEQGGPPAALAGLKPDQNLYVNPRGQWIGRYIPAHVRRYAFMLAYANTPEGEPRLTIQLDIEAPHFSNTDGQPLLTEKGEATELLQRVQKILVGLQHEMQTSEALVKELEALELLVPRAIGVQPQGQEAPTRVSGFRVVDTEKLAALPAEQFGKLHASGALMLIHAHLISLSNLSDGWLTKAAATQASGEVDVEEIFGGKDDTLKFNF